MSEGRQATPRPMLEMARRISVILPDDGTDQQLMKILLRDKGITRAASVPLRAVSALRKARTKPGQLPEPMLARLVSVIVAEQDANAVFDFVFEAANICRPGGGMIIMAPLLGATSYALPHGVPEEPGG